MESYRRDLGGPADLDQVQQDDPESMDQPFDNSDSLQSTMGLSTTWWIIIIVAVIIVIVLIAVLVWWKLRGSNSSFSSDNTTNNTTINNRTNPVDLSIFNQPSSDGTKPPKENETLSVKPTGYVVNNPNVQSWFQGKTLDLSPPIIGYLTTEVNGKKYGLTIRPVGTTYKVFLTEYSTTDVNNSIAARCCTVRWNYKKTDTSIKTYLVASNNSGTIGVKNVGVDNEGLPMVSDNFEKDNGIPLVLLAQYDQRNNIQQYYLVDMAGNPVCFTQDNVEINTGKLQLGMINPAVFKEQYAKLPIVFQIELRSYEPLNYALLHVNTIERNNLLKLNNPWTGRWYIGSSMKQYQLNDKGLLPTVLVRLNKLDYTIAVEPDGIASLKVTNTLCLTPVDYSKAPIYIQDDANHTKITTMFGMTKAEIRQSSTGILNIDPDQNSPQDNTLQVYEDTSDNSVTRLMILGKFQTPVLLVNGTGYDITEPGLVGIRVWNPEVYPKQKKLVLRYKKRPTGLDWSWQWMKCERCSDVFNYNYDLDDDLGGNMDERKAGRCPRSRIGWTEDYGNGHWERHDDHNYMVARGSSWGVCLYCRCLCSLEIPGSCYSKEQGQMIPHNIWTETNYCVELFEHEVADRARSRAWCLCDKCGVLWRDDGTYNICTDGNQHSKGQRYFMISEKGRWDT